MGDKDSGLNGINFNGDSVQSSLVTIKRLYDHKNKLTISAMRNKGRAIVSGILGSHHKLFENLYYFVTIM